MICDDIWNLAKSSEFEPGVRTPGSASVSDAENEVMVGSVLIIFTWIASWIFWSGVHFTKTFFHFWCFFCLYVLPSIANYSNQQIWSVRTRIVANMIQNRMLRALLKWCVAVESKVHTSQIRKWFFRIVQKDDVFSFEFAHKEEEASKTTVATWYR